MANGRQEIQLLHPVSVNRIIYIYIHICTCAGILTDLNNYRFGTSWGLCVFGMLCVIPVIWYRVHDTELTAEDFVTPAEKGMAMETVKETEA